MFTHSRLQARLERLLPIGLPILVAAAALFFFFWRLGVLSMQDYDEAIYAQVAREIAQGGGWLTLHNGSMDWFQKPPLAMWLMAALYKLFSVSDVTARAVSAAAGVGTALLTFQFAKRYAGNWAGLASVAVLLTSSQFMATGRQAMLDPLLTFWIYLAFFFLLKVNESSSRNWYGVGIACALAIMTKSAAGLLAPITIAFFIAFNRSYWNFFKQKHFWGGVLSGLIVVVPWHLWMYIQYGHTFWDQYMGYHVLTRAEQPIEGHGGDFWTYFYVIQEKFFPWAYVACLAVASTIRNLFTGKKSSLIMVLAAVCTYVLYGVLIQSKLDQYIIPMYPALAVMVGVYVVQAIREADTFLFIGLIAIGIFLGSEQTVNMRLDFLAILALILLVSGKITWLTPQRGVALAVGIFMVGLGLQSVKPLYSRAHYAESATLAKAALASEADQSKPFGQRTPIIYCPGTPGWSTSMAFYSNRPLVSCTTAQDIIDWVRKGTSTDVMIGKYQLTAFSPAVHLTPVFETENYVYAKASLNP